MQKLIESAQWITAPASFVSPVFHRQVQLHEPKKARLAVSALGIFRLYINGALAADEYFRPSGSIYRSRDFREVTYPVRDSFTYRVYYSIYDVSRYLRPGENRIEIAVGDGWYRQTDRVAEGQMAFGDALGVIFALSVQDADGENIILSDGTEQCRTSERTYSNLFYGEHYDARIAADNAYTYAPVTVTEMPESILTPEIAPPDRIIRTITPVLLSDLPEKKIYDAGENIAGLVSFTTRCGRGETVRLRFAEKLRDGALDFGSTGADFQSPAGVPQIQEDIFIGDGNEHWFMPQFVWHGFRYFEVIGVAENVQVQVIHSDVPVTSAFHCDVPELNQLYENYLRSQLGNMHMGYPSDCPHRERLGYTGDGQVCAPAAMLMLDGRDFYRKWICDIFDSQDPVTGHVNHTAPFQGGGGGPGGWGMAAINVPYYYYKIYGDTAPAREYFGRMKKWVSYLTTRMEDGLIVREEEGGWCLGDWCTLQKTVIPEAYVNTCLFIRSLRYLEELAVVLGRTEDRDDFEKQRKQCEEAVIRRWYDPATHSFAEGVQGADAFALAAGLGDDGTFDNLVEAYRRLGHFDTGFIGTDLLVDVLFAGGEATLPVQMMASHALGGYGYMWDHGATTIWEYWDGGCSGNHPMFGACARSLFTHILGIRQPAESAGYDALVIEPQIPENMETAAGSIQTVHGTVAVEWQKHDNQIHFHVEIPAGRNALFAYGDTKKTLGAGAHEIIMPTAGL